MKHLHRIFTLAICIAVAIGCAKEQLVEVVAGRTEGGMIPLNIDGSIHQVPTKVSASGFSDKDAIGLFAVNYTDGNANAGTLLLEGNQADNAKYIYSEENLRWKSTRAVYYKDVNTNVDLFLYYPYQNIIDDINAFKFEISADQNVTRNGARMSGYEMSDFLWGKATNIAPTESKVPVVLNHIMSSVKVNLIEGNGFSDGEWNSLFKGIVVTNTRLNASIDFATGVVSPTGDVQMKGIVMTEQDEGSFRAIVVPQTIPAGTSLFAMTVGTVTYNFKSETETTYQGGKISDFDITVNKKGITGECEFILSGNHIIDWIEDKNSHGGEARQYFVVNVEHRGELGKTIREAKKNSDRIRNLKITGEIGCADFSFMRDSMKILEAVNLKECRTHGPVSGSTSAYFCDQWEDQWNNLDRYISENGRQPDYSYRNSEGYMEYYWYKELDWDVIPVNAFSNKKSLCFFAFPEDTKFIASNAFSGSGLSGALIIPDKVTEIGERAFSSSSVSSVSFNDKLEKIGNSSFSDCSSLSGELLLPESLVEVGNWCFSNCSFYGRFILPESLETVKDYAFSNCGSFNGDLEIPENINTLPNGVFSGCKFAGSLVLNNVTSIGQSCFNSCNFKGELDIPEGVTEIEENAFSSNAFSSIHFPSTLRRIGKYAFGWNQRLCCDLIFPEGLISIGEAAFESNSLVTAIELPSSIQTIQARTFNGLYNVTRFLCKATEPPIVISGAFDGVPKDNFALEVPAQSVKRYQSESGWADFKRIGAHYEFSIGRNLMRGLNASLSRTYTLRVPSGFDWSIESKPEWVSVSPESGTGKTDVTVTMAEMDRTENNFEVQVPNEWGGYYTEWRKGRAGEIVFKLDKKDYTCAMTVQQFDCDYADGEVVKYNVASKGAGIDIVFIGDGYDASDIAKGDFLSNAKEGFGHFFDVEPYKTYKDYFNVYAVISMSDESGIGTVNQIKDVKFGSYFSSCRLLPPNTVECFEWAKKANSSLDVTKSLTIVMMNTSTYEGVTVMGYDNSALAVCPVSREPYPYDYRGIIQHEAGGHAFGKLGDEYIYHNAFVQACCCCCCDHPTSEDDLNSNFGRAKACGWFKNLSMKANASQVPWAHLIYNPDYSDYVDMFEGGYMHGRGMYRSEATSCMNNNIPYYSTISRQAIVERIKDYAGEPFSLEDFYANDSNEFGTVSKSGKDLYKTFGVDPGFVRASGRAPIFVESIK